MERKLKIPVTEMTPGITGYSTSLQLCAFEMGVSVQASRPGRQEAFATRRLGGGLTRYLLCYGIDDFGFRCQPII